MSSSRMRAFVGIAAVATLAVVLASTNAYAQGAPVPTLTSATVNGGGADNVSGGGCAARVSVQIQFDGVVLVRTRSDATGKYSAHLIIPVHAVPGSHRVTVVCVGSTGTEITEAAAVNVGLPLTGSNTVPLVATAASLLILGGLLSARRRRSVT